MADISKLPGVTQTWPSKPIKSVHKKDKRNKKESNRDKSQNSNNKEEDNGSEHIDEYA